MATGFPGYDLIIPLEKGTIRIILKDNGYATSWFGKDHNTPFYQASLSRAIQSMAERDGLRLFDGFVAGDASQRQPTCSA